VELAQAGMRGVVLPPPQGSERKVAPMTVSSPNVIEIKVDRLIDDMRFLRSQMIAFDRRLHADPPQRRTLREMLILLFHMS
jgi:hypothetical protein